MGDQDFNIKVVTTADTTGIRQVSKELDDVTRKEEADFKARIAARKLEWDKLRPPPVPPIPSAPVVSEAGAAAEAATSIATIATGAAVAIGAGYKKLYSVLQEASKFQETLIANTIAQGNELDKLAIKWTEAAGTAESYADVGRLLSSVTGELEKVADKTREVNTLTTTLTQDFEEFGLTIIRLTSGLPGLWTPFTDALRQAREEQGKLQAVAKETALAMIDVADQSKVAWENLKLEPVTQSVEELTSKLEAYKDSRAGVNRADADAVQQIDFYNKRIVDTESKLKILTSTQDRLEESTKRVQESLKKVNFDNLSDPAKLDALSTRLKEINEDLETLGIKSKTASDILEEAKGLSPEDARKAVKSAQDLVTVNGQIVSITEKITKATTDWAKLHDETLQDSREQLVIAQARASGNTQLVTELEHERDLRKEVTELMRKGLSYEEASHIATTQRAIKLEQEAAGRIHEDVFKGPATAAQEAQARQRDFAAHIATQRELAAEGAGKEVTQGEAANVQRAEELRQLQRKQTLQRSLLPEGAGPAEMIKTLGPKGLKDFEADAERIKKLQAEKELGRPETRAEEAKRQAEERDKAAKEETRKRAEDAINAEEERAMSSEAVQAGYVSPEDVRKKYEEQRKQLGPPPGGKKEEKPESKLEKAVTDLGKKMDKYWG